ncbi:MAG: histidinol dehydrogenase, partial [Xanthomonadales bacterium]|nr:histidinol dehydrogenase [Xanthomonadales bacterium]
MNIRIPETINWAQANTKQRTAAIRRPPLPELDIAQDVAAIITQIREEGDDALRRLTRKFDKVELDQLEVSASEWAAAESAVDKEVLQAIDDAIARIDSFHRAGMPGPVSIETAPGVRCEARYLPISPVGLYVPGGTAPLVSTVLMLAVPARIAGCKDIILCTPPDREGRVPAAILAAAARCGVKRVFKAGGAQAIAAMGVGTQSIPGCAKLFGPGNAWVTEAKQQIAAMPGGAARDMPAGPSEVVVIADADADPVAVCWDLLSQAEHGPDSQSIVISDDQRLLDQIGDLLVDMAAGLPRAAILAESLRYLRRIRVDSISRAVEISNFYAPEHLILNCREPERVADAVTAAGSV